MGRLRNDTQILHRARESYEPRTVEKDTVTREELLAGAEDGSRWNALFLEILRARTPKSGLGPNDHDFWSVS